MWTSFQVDSDRFVACWGLGCDTCNLSWFCFELNSLFRENLIFFFNKHMGIWGFLKHSRQLSVGSVVLGRKEGNFYCFSQIVITLISRSAHPFWWHWLCHHLASWLPSRAFLFPFTTGSLFSSSFLAVSWHCDGEWSWLCAWTTYVLTACSCFADSWERQISGSSWGGPLPVYRI